MRTYAQAKKLLKEADDDRVKLEEDMRRNRAAAIQHSADDGYPTALHAATPSEPATRDTLDCTGQPRMYEGVLIRMSQPKREKRGYLTVAQIAGLLELEPRTVSGYCEQARWPAEKAGGETGGYRVQASDFWAWAAKHNPAGRLVRMQAHWPKDVAEPWK